ncbi:MAG: hypothetical protein LBL45_05065 [Treponema sp.]|nr:hypothetical protein [Treponema sp.]
MKVKRHWLLLFLSPGLALFLFVYFASIVSVVGTSFTDWRIGQEMRLSGLRNYLSLFQSAAFLKALGNNIIWILLQSTIHVAIGVLFCLIIAWKKKQVVRQSQPDPIYASQYAF